MMVFLLMTPPFNKVGGVIIENEYYLPIFYFYKKYSHIFLFRS